MGALECKQERAFDWGKNVKSILLLERHLVAKQTEYVCSTTFNTFKNLVCFFMSRRYLCLANIIWRNI